MNQRALLFFGAACALFASCSADSGVEAGAQATPGLLNPNVATQDELSGLPGMSESVVAALVEARPFAGALELDAFLGEQGLEEAARQAVYAHAFVNANLNTAGDAEFRLIPGVGEKMAHEFDEYRPWKSWAQYEKEIGKYVDTDELARLRPYLFIPLDLNEASEADFLSIPGVGKKMAHEFDEYRPWKSKSQFEKEIGKYVDEKEVRRLWRFFVIEGAER